MLLHLVHHRFHGWFSAACLAALLLAACQPAAAPLATLAPTVAALPSATITAQPPTLQPTATDTDIPASLTPTTMPSATLSPAPRPPIPTADFARGDVLGIWMRSDAARGNLIITFREDGTYSVACACAVHGGKFTLDGRLLTWVDGWDCSPKPRDTPGQYVLRITDGGKYLSMARYDDKCPDRPNVLANFRWTRIISTPTPVP